MLPRQHPHFAPLLISTFYFGLSATVLFSFSHHIKELCLAPVFFGIAGICAVLATLSVLSLFSKTSSTQYYGVFSIKTQRRIRQYGLIFPWLFLALFLGNYFVFAKIKEASPLIKVQKRDNSNRRIADTKYTEKMFTDFARQVTVHLLKVDGKTFRPYTKALIDKELSRKVINSLRNHQLLPADAKEFDSYENYYQSNSYRAPKLTILKPEFLGLTKKEKFVKVRVGIITEEFGAIKKTDIEYHIGIKTSSRNFIVARLLETYGYSSDPSWLLRRDSSL